MTKLDCPLVILTGHHDRSVNSQVAHEWFERVQSPANNYWRD
jgi:surfactin synthase thioesterase subunit